LVAALKGRLLAAGLSKEAEFFPNVNRAGKLDFLSRLTVFSVPAIYGEAFGLYVIEALAAGVPVVQPRTAAFPELIKETGGGVLCAPANVEALTASIEELLLNAKRAQELGQAGQRAVFEKFTAEIMARTLLKEIEPLNQKSQSIDSTVTYAAGTSVADG